MIGYAAQVQVVSSGGRRPHTRERLTARLEAVRKRCETIVFEESASGGEGCPALRALQRIAAMRVDEVLDEEEVEL